MSDENKLKLALDAFESILQSNRWASKTAQTENIRSQSEYMIKVLKDDK